MNPSAPAEASGADRRRPRLVTMQVAVRLELPGGLAFEGHTTGLNENGVGARVNLVDGELTAPIGGTEARILLDLPEKESQAPPLGRVLRLEGSWVPGFQYFVTLQFVGISPEFVIYLRRFIRWREEEYFTQKKPPRHWYLFSSSLQQQFGPLTTQEVRLALSRGEHSGVDLMWMPDEGQWTPFEHDKFMKIAAAFDRLDAEENIAPKEEEPPSEGERAADAASEPSRLGAQVASAGRRKIAIAAMLLLLAAAGAVGAYRTSGFGLMDLDAAKLYKEAVRLRREGNYYLASDKFKEIVQDHAASAWAAKSKAQLEICLDEVRVAEDRKKAERQLQLLQKIPVEKQRHPYVLNNFGDCYFRMGDFVRAREYFLRALEADKTDDKGRYNLATTYLRLGDYEVAEKTFEEVGGRIAEQPEYFINRGLAALARGKRPDALQLFDQALRLDPQNQALKARIDAIAALGG